MIMINHMASLAEMILRALYWVMRGARVVDSLSAWECLCGHDVCEWCSWPYEPLALPTPGLSLYWHTDGTAVVMGRYDHDLV